MNNTNVGLDFYSKFHNEDDCVEYIKSLIIKNGFLCKKCKHTEMWLNSRQVMICKRCGNERSMTAGTIFHKKRKVNLLVFYALWLFITKPNVQNAKALQRELGIGNYRSAFTLLHKFRALMRMVETQKLSGNIYVDDTSVGIKIPSKVKSQKKTWPKVMIAVDKENQRIKTSLLAVYNNCNIKEFIKANIEPDSYIVTDQDKLYGGLSELGYNHEVINLPDNENIIPGVCEIALALKKFLLESYENYIIEKYLPLYLAEFTFRFNTKNNYQKGLLYQKLLDTAILRNLE